MAWLLIFIFPIIKAPLGFGAVVIVGALIVRRLLVPQSVVA
jgi:hypothetical protein